MTAADLLAALESAGGRYSDSLNAAMAYRSPANNALLSRDREALGDLLRNHSALLTRALALAAAVDEYHRAEVAPDRSPETREYQTALAAFRAEEGRGR